MIFNILYALHALLETVAFVLIFPKGAYPSESKGEKMVSPTFPGAKGRKRTHALGLLALAILGALVLAHGLVDTQTGLIASQSLLVFHAGCSSLDLASGKRTYFVHYPFAVGFAAHVVSFYL